MDGSSLPLDFPLSVDAESWTVLALVFVNRTLGTWIVQQYQTKLHPAEHSVTAVARANQDIADDDITVGFVRAQKSDISLGRPTLQELRFPHEAFKHIFSQLRQKLEVIPKALRFDDVAQMNRVRSSGEIIDSVGSDPKEGGEQEGVGSIATIKLEEEGGKLDGVSSSQELDINLTNAHPFPATPTSSNTQDQTSGQPPPTTPTRQTPNNAGNQSTGGRTLTGAPAHLTGQIKPQPSSPTRRRTRSQTSKQGKTQSSSQTTGGKKRTQPSTRR